MWLHLKNGPLDPIIILIVLFRSMDPKRTLWVTVANREQLPPRYRQWARMTVVGRVIGTTDQEPILLLMYARGWDYSGKNEDTLGSIDRSGLRADRSPMGFTENSKHSNPPVCALRFHEYHPAEGAAFPHS